PNTIVESIKIVGTNIFVGGAFTTNGGVAVNGIARWDRSSSSWKAYGTGITGGSIPLVDAIEYDGTDLFIGGSFTTAGGVNATNVARWNGSAWQAMGNGFSGGIYTLLKFKGYLYAGGAFTNVSLGIFNLAKWDGTSWSAVGTGADRPVRSLISDGTNLYIGGDFNQINGMAAGRIVKFDGVATWTTLGAGV